MESLKDEDVTETEMAETAATTASSTLRSFDTLPPMSFSRNRRRSLPTNALSGPLYRTTSHKKLPHLSVERVASTPMGFSPKAGKDTVHGCHSHCLLPHLPGSARRRRHSLPPVLGKLVNSTNEMPVVRQRRQSYPLAQPEINERSLHRCKALHKTNITFENISSELKNMSKESRSIQKVKSDTAISTGETKEQNKNLSVLLMHYIDSTFIKNSSCTNASSSILSPQSLTKIEETA